MKNYVLISIFILITLACLVIGGVESINLILKSVLYMVGMGALMGVGVVYMARHLDEEAA